jgi:hypothetical protein
MASIFIDSRFAWAQFFVFVLAVLYAFIVRWRETK